MVINQCQDTFYVKNPNLSKHEVRVKQFLTNFQLNNKEISIFQVLREESIKIDALVKLRKATIDLNNAIRGNKLPNNQ